VVEEGLSAVVSTTPRSRTAQAMVGASNGGGGTGKRDSVDVSRDIS
jgi:hypothetical protein